MGNSFKGVTHGCVLSIYTDVRDMCGCIKNDGSHWVMKQDIPIGKADLNYVQDLAVDYEIESVPCLLIKRMVLCKHKIYAFQSVPYLLENDRLTSYKIMIIFELYNSIE